MPLDVIKASDMSPTRSSIHVVAGPPGLGKSWFCGTVGEVVPPEEVLLIATLPREVKSVKYQQYDYDTVVIYDDDWEPFNEKYGATGCQQLIDLLRELRTDEKYSAIILDSGTEASEMAWHAALAPLKVGDPSELKNKFEPYTKTGELMEQVVRSIAKLAGHPAGGRNSVTKNKFVLMTWHVQPPKDSIGSDETADEKGSGVEYEGSVLPMIRGRFRRRLGQLVDSFVYVDRVAKMNSVGQNEMKHMIQVRSTIDKHCKFPGLLPKGITHVENSFPEYLDLVDTSIENLKKQKDNG